MSSPIPLPPKPGELVPLPRPTSEFEMVIHVLERAIRDPSVDMARIKEGREVIREMAQELKLAAYNDALAKFQAEMPAVIMTGEVVIPGRKTQKYPTLGDVIKTMREPAGKHGLSVQQSLTYPAPNIVAVTTVVGHSMGHCAQTTLQGSIDKTGGKNDIQAQGSIITYLRRYGIMLMLNIATAGEDDDGQGAETSVSDEQVKELEDLITQTGGSIESYCKSFKVENLGDLTPVRFASVRGQLVERKRAQTKHDQRSDNPSAN